MALDESNRERNYLFGRLLATAEMLEKKVLRMQDVKRNTAAERFFLQFQKRPAQTWMTIYRSLNPYILKLEAENMRFYITEMHKITSLLDMAEITDNKSLDNRFLLGYCSQMDTYEHFKTTDDKEKE